jgi:hypothetical protein
LKPDREAVEALAIGVHMGRLALLVGIVATFDTAIQALERVAAGKFGPAVLKPSVD